MTDCIEWYREQIGTSEYEFKYNIPYYAPSFLICVVQCILITLDNQGKDIATESRQQMIQKISEHSILKESLLTEKRLEEGKYEYDFQVLRELVNVMEEKYNIKFKHKDMLPLSFGSSTESKNKILALLWNYCPMFNKTSDTLELLVREKVKR